MRNSGVQRDWGLIIGGIILFVCAIVILLWPGASLATLTLIAGICFIAAGALELFVWSRFNPFVILSAWSMAYAILNIVFGLILVIHPIAFSMVLPWLIGFFLLGFAGVEIAGALMVRQVPGSGWGWILASGIVSLLCGLALFFWPSSLMILLSAFLIMQAVAMIKEGATVAHVIQ